MVRTFLGGRIVASRTHGLVAIGDLLAVVLFAALGEYRHAGTVLTLGETAIQFGLGWALIAPLAGAYGPGALDDWRRAAGLGAVAWVFAAAVGVLLRYLVEVGASLSLVFFLVAAGVGAVIVAIWRGAAAAWLAGR